MKVILLTKIRSFGNIGSEVNVKAGFARNYLLPQKKALIANDANRAVFAEQRAELEEQAQKEIAVANELAEKIQSMEHELETSTGPEGKLFGSIGPREMCEFLKNTGINISKSAINMPMGRIREVGSYEVFIAVHPDVQCKISLNVISDNPNFVATEKVENKITEPDESETLPADETTEAEVAEA